ncbi:glycerophosphodiester phosphodiesterase family protein [Thioalkalivibrio sp.]|uniref:glycerophosphodiester phosphodiesterase family protein n=1 Tax=Thioalkalivibrio sp. TaxID=2093813 RepID=UPI0012D6C180|nr:glycerophosphodiester phosphodiesterase family protein [Thioalkalivibrio sp.]TVP81638.1 MAG: glycerophosphodiester phosphodiesterase [Thioalkalivibrio sp.]
MKVLQDVFASYRASLQFLAPFTLIHLSIRLLAAAVIVPVSGLVLAAALAASGQNVVTDQDIAWFLLTPVGFAGALALISLSIVASVLDVAVMTDTLRRQEHRVPRALLSGLGLFLGRFAGLFAFALQLVLRVLLIAAPFLLVGAAIAWLALGRYDINYYLTYRPPAFLAAAGIGAVLLAGLAVVLVARLSSWAIALHLFLFGRVPPRRSFAESARRLQGQRMQVVWRIVVWALLRSLLFALVASIAALLVSGAQQLFGANLRVLAFSIVALLLLWGLANAVVSAFANGALASLLERLYREATGDVPESTRVVAGRPLAVGALPVLLLLGGAAVALGGGLYLGGSLAERVSAEREVEIIAHRGASVARPENTMAAFEQALVEGADWIELDVQETADGEVVVAHDSDFMKMAGVDLKVWDATMADLAEMDIGSWFDSAYSGERTPTLREVLLATKGRGKVLIELKYYGRDIALEPRVVEIVEETGMSADIAVMSLKIEGVRKMQALRPDWTHGVLAATAVGDLSALDADFLAVNTGQVSVDLIRRTHAQGRKLYVWTVNDPVTMVRLISMGVDGLITDEPALARQVMEARNQLSAPERLLLWVSDRFRLKSFDLVAEEADA